MEQYKDLTAAQKVKALALLKAAYIPLNGETDADFLARLGQVFLRQRARQLYRLQQEQLATNKADFE